MIAPLALFAALACAPEGTASIPGTTTRLTEVRVEGKANDLSVAIFADEEACRAGNVAEADVAACRPYVDRGSGTVRLGFQIRVQERPWPIPLGADLVGVWHNNRGPVERVQLVPHDPVPTPQLLVLLIDATSSMDLMDPGERESRLEKVRRALLQVDVVEAFFPPGIRNAVVPLVLNGGPEPLPLVPDLVITEKEAWRAALRDQLPPPRGYTRLYDGLLHVMRTSLQDPRVRGAMAAAQQQPTVIALTDGFNDPDHDWTCRDNVAALQLVLGALRELRATSDVQTRPSLFAVGLGRKAWPGFRRENGHPVDEGTLCRSAGARRIDGDLENRGVDNAGLELLAWDGGGQAFVSRDQRGLAEAFKAAAAQRYRWFEVRYSVDAQHLRRAWDSTLRLATVGTPQARAHFVPNAWIDGVPGTRGTDGWPTPGRLAAALGVLLPAFGTIVSLSFLPAAVHNVRRAIVGLMPRRRR